MIYVVDIACPSEKNVQEKVVEKLRKYQQLAFELRERRPGVIILIVPVVIECLGGGMKDTLGPFIREKISRGLLWPRRT